MQSVHNSIKDLALPTVVAADLKMKPVLSERLRGYAEALSAKIQKSRSSVIGERLCCWLGSY